MSIEDKGAEGYAVFGDNKRVGGGIIRNGPSEGGILVVRRDSYLVAGHLYILQTPLFRIRNKKEAKRKNGGKEKGKAKVETYYCYTDEERVNAINKLGDKAEITRFKGLGEIDPEEFADFIGPDMRLDRVHLRKEDTVNKMLEFYMGKNTMERQEFIIDNLVIEDDEDITVH